MGLNEVTPRTIKDAKAEKETVVRNVIKQTVRGLLINGGAIAHSGEVLSTRYADLKIERLSETQKQTLEKAHVLRVRPYDARPTFPAGHDVRVSAVHVIPAGVIERLGYEIAIKGALRFLIEGCPQDGITEYQYINSDNRHLGVAFTNFAREILKREHLWDPYFEMKKYTDGILKEIADSEGLGKINLKEKNRTQPQQASLYLLSR